MKIKIISNAKLYAKRHILIGNRRRIRTLYRNMPKYAIDRDTWLARHGQSTGLNRSPRAREALSELNLFRIGIPRRFIVAIRKMHEAKFKATPHPKFKPS